MLRTFGFRLGRRLRPRLRVCLCWSGPPSRLRRPRHRSKLLIFLVLVLVLGVRLLALARCRFAAPSFIISFSSPPSRRLPCGPQPQKQYASCEFQNTSIRGAFGDALREVDWIVGNVVAKLDAVDVMENTLILFTGVR